MEKALAIIWAAFIYERFWIEFFKSFYAVH